MEPKDIDQVLAKLNDMLKKDQMAIWSLMNNKVPCKPELGESVPVTKVMDGTTVGTLGVINAIVLHFTGQMVATNWVTDKETHEIRLLGFIRYTGPLPSRKTASISGERSAVQ